MLPGAGGVSLTAPDPLAAHRWPAPCTPPLPVSPVRVGELIDLLRDLDPLAFVCAGGADVWGIEPLDLGGLVALQLAPQVCGDCGGTL